MEAPEKEQMLAEAIENQIENLIRENRMTYAQIIGVLEMLKTIYLEELLDEDVEDSK